MHEPRRVVDRPRRDHDRRGQHRGAEPPQPLAPRAIARRPHQRHDERTARAGSTRIARARPCRTRAPTSTSRRQLGACQYRYASSSVAAAANIESVSAWSMPSGAQRFGYSAAITAAMMPTRAPPTARPSRPTSHTVAVPSTHDQSRCVSTLFIPSTDGIARKTMYSGGCSAAARCSPTCDEERRDEALAVGEQVRARVVEERVAVRVEVAARTRTRTRPAARARRRRRARARGGTSAGRAADACGSIAASDQSLPGGPMKTAIGMLRSSICVISVRVLAGTFGASASMNRLSSTCGDEVAEPGAAQIGRRPARAAGRTPPAPRRIAGSKTATWVKRESCCQFAMSGPVARCTSSVGVRVVDHVVAGRAGPERLLGAHVEAAAVELVQQAEAGRTDRLRVGQPRDQIRARVCPRRSSCVSAVGGRADHRAERSR